MNQQVKYMLRTYESFIIHSSSSSFNHHHQTKNYHKQTCNRATLRSFSVKKIVVRMKNVKFRGFPRKKKKFRGSIPRVTPRQKPKFRGSARNSAVPRKLWALLTSSTLILSS